MSSAAADDLPHGNATATPDLDTRASLSGTHDTATNADKSQTAPTSANGAAVDGAKSATTVKSVTSAAPKPRRSPSPSMSPHPENEPVVVQHLREMFTDISDTLITDAYRSGLVNGTTEQMYMSFFNRAQRIVEQLVQMHGPELYVRVMHDNLIRLLSTEFKERTPQQVYNMCNCCMQYLGPTMLFTSLLSTDCLEQLIEYTDAMLREDQTRSRHGAPRGRHGGSAGGHVEHISSNWYMGSRSAPGSMSGSGPGHTNPSGAAAGRHRGGVVSGVTGTGSGLGGTASQQVSMGPGAGAEPYLHQSPLPSGNQMNANNQVRNQVPDVETAPRFASSPRSPNTGTAGVSASSYHSIPAPRGLTSGYVVRSEEGNAPSAIKQPLPRSATLMQQQQQPQQQRPVQPQVSRPQPGVTVEDRMVNSSHPPRHDVLVPAAYVREPPTSMGRPVPVSQFTGVPQTPDQCKSPSPQLTSDRAAPPPRRFAHHHHHHHSQSSPGAAVAAAPSVASLSHSLTVEPPRGVHSVPASPPPAAGRATPSAVAVTPGVSQTRVGMMPPAHHHHHHHHPQMHRDPVTNVSPQPSMSRQPSQPSGSTASPMLPRSMEGMQPPAAPIAHVASPQPPQPAGTPGTLAVTGTGTPQPSSLQSGVLRLGSLPRPHHHHHHGVHANMFSGPGTVSSPYEATPLGVTGPADGAFAFSHASAPPATVSRDASSIASGTAALPRPAAAPAAPAIPSIMPRHHHHHHHHQQQVALPAVLVGRPDNSVQRPPNSVDGGAAGGDEMRDPASRGSPAAMTSRTCGESLAAADEVTSYLMRAGVEQRAAMNVATKRCTLGDLRSLPWSQMEHLLRISGVPPASFPALRESLVGAKEESPSQLQQFLQRNNIAAHSINSSTANDSMGSPAGSTSTLSLSQRDGPTGRGGMHVPQPRTRQTGSSSPNGGAPTAADANDTTGSPATSSTGRTHWGAEVSTDSAVPDGARGRRGKAGGGRGGGRGGRGSGEEAQVCKYYKKLEGCQFGSNCRYRHVDA